MAKVTVVMARIPVEVFTQKMSRDQVLQRAPINNGTTEWPRRHCDRHIVRPGRNAESLRKSHRKGLPEEKEQQGARSTPARKWMKSE